MRVRWLNAALLNLDDIATYLSQDNPRAAREVVAAIWRQTQVLARYPALGRAGRVAGTRELVIAGLPYIVPYRMRDQAIEILRVLHASRRWPRRL